MNLDAAFKESITKAHAQAVSETKKKMPDVDLSDLLRLAVDVVMKKKEPAKAAKELAEQYRVPAETYLKTFMKISSLEGVDYLLMQARSAGVQNLAGTDFSENMLQASGKAALVVQQYYKGEINGPHFIEGLFGSGLGDVGKQYAGAMGIDIVDPKVIYDTVVNASALTMAFACASEAYRILAKAMDDASVQHEKTLKIQAECEKSVAMILQYRKEMEEMASQYLGHHIEIFEAGFRAMDQAVLANDTDAYLKGNAAIQSILGYEVQFETKDEFDDLMSSDIPLKL